MYGVVISLVVLLFQLLSSLNSYSKHNYAYEILGMCWFHMLVAAENNSVKLSPETRGELLADVQILHTASNEEFSIWLLNF